MDGKQDKPPAYSAPQAPPLAFQGQGPQDQFPQGSYYPGGNMDYYGGQPQGGPYPPQQFAQYPPGQYVHPGYPPQGYPREESSQAARAAGTGCLGAILGVLACCCCLDILF